jgi:tetratricopeptide (TPR) repeat protein
VREEASAEHRRALAAGQPSPFDAEFLRPRAGHAPFAAPCGLEDQSLLLYKLGKAGVAADAIRYEQQLWAADTQAGVDAVAYLDSLVKKGADSLSIASARNAVAFAAKRKGDLARAEHELRLVIEAYAEAWPRLSISDRRYYADEYLGALESLIEILRSARQFNEAIALGETANRIAAEAVNEYDSLRLDALLSLAKTFREMRDAPRAEAAASTYLDAVVRARGDTSADYAWALRTISYAYLLGDELDASGRMEMQAKAIWAKQSIVAPEF